MTTTTPSATTGSKSDRTIQDNVRAELVWRPEVRDAEVGVSVLDGVVTLSGEVDTYTQRIAAKKAALAVLGVSVVANDLTIRNAARSDRTDTDIAVSVEKLLGWSTDVSEDRINVEVRDHVVHLTGTLDWDYQRRDVVRMIRRLNGVHRVDNQITLTPRTSAPDTAKRIKAALVRHALVDANSITVTTNGPEITLAGHVHTWDEANAAVYAAWGSPHVSAVHNMIRIRP